MYYKPLNKANLSILDQTGSEAGRYLNPQDINLPPGYTIEVYAQGLDAPSGMVFTENGDILIALSGYISKDPSILRLSNGRIEFIAGDFIPPISGINYMDGDIYVTQKGKITVIKPDGTRRDIIMGLPNYGDFWSSNVAFSYDRKLYFGIGTSTNSGVVGTDNVWVYDYPFNCDYPGAYVILNGQNFETSNLFSTKAEKAYTGAFSPYGIPNTRYEVRKGIKKASGSILRSNLDGTELEQVAWGFRWPIYMKFDLSNRLFAANQGYEARGCRPISNAPDEFQLVSQGVWYGWPDFAGGLPVTSPKFQADGGKQTEFLLTNHPNVPPTPFAMFPSGSAIAGFDFNSNKSFASYGDAFITEFGSGGRIAGSDITTYAGKGHRISQISMRTGTVTTFAINKSGFPSSITREGGLERPVDLAFGPDGAMYILDLAMNSPSNPSNYYPNTGVIWKVTKTG